MGTRVERNQACSALHQCMHLPYLVVLTFIPALCCLAPSFMEHNVMTSGKQTDPEPACMTGSPLQCAYGLLTCMTSQFVGSTASRLMPQLLNAERELEGAWKQPVIVSSSSVVAVLTAGRESKGEIQMSRETLSYTTAIYVSIVPCCPFSTLKVLALDRAVSVIFFLHHCLFLFIFRSRTFTFSS